MRASSRILRSGPIGCALLLAVVMLLLATAAVACGGADEDEQEQAPQPAEQVETITATSEAEPEEQPAAPAQPPEEPAVPAQPPTEEAAPLQRPAADYDAAAAAITVDGDTAEWSGVDALPVHLSPIADREGEVGEYDATLRIASDGETLYVLVEVDDDYNFNPDDAHLSAALAVLFPIDASAGTAMGATEDDQETSLGLVDLWHWELDCGPGVLSGTVSSAGGNDPACNLDDEVAGAPEDREDDAAETSLIGAWSHTNPTADAAGTWIFEMARPLVTGDPEDAQFESGGVAAVAVAYWDADETPAGWEDDGHAVSVSDDRPFLTVQLP